MEKEIIEKIIYYTSVVLACIPLTVIYIITDNQTSFFFLLSLLATTFGVRIALNEIPSWLKTHKSEKAVSDLAVTANKMVDKYEPILDRGVKVIDQMLMEGIEEREEELEEQSELLTEEQDVTEDIQKKIAFLTKKDS